MNLAALQLSTLPMNDSKFDYYARICEKKDIKLLVLGEYVLNSFFKELEVMPKSMIKEQANHKVKMLQNISKKYDMTIIAPIIKVQGNSITKSVAKATPKSMRYYPQQFLINYKHWNEEKFFENSSDGYELPTFSQDGLKFAIVSGFEVHFDYVWSEIDKKKIDVVLMPSVSTFESKQRWDEVIKTRAFTHNVYILRVNRIGTYKEENWHFYGHSALFNPHGEIEQCLDDEEAMLMTNVEKSKVQEARNLWGWKKILSKKGLI